MARNPLFSSYKGEPQSRESLHTGAEQKYGSSSSDSSKTSSQVQRSASRQQDIMSDSESRSDRGLLSLSRQRQPIRTGSGNVRQGGGDSSSGYNDPQIKSGNVSNGSSSLSENDNQPPSKRRKTEETTGKDKEDVWEDDDDDDFNFTQADLEQMDIMASQAIASKESGPPEPEGSSKTIISESSANRVNTAKASTGSYQAVTASTSKSVTSAFIKPKVLMSSSSSSSDRSRETSINESTESVHGSRRSSSESGTSSYPSSLSHVGSRDSSLRSSSSIKSVSSDEVGPGQLRRQGSNPSQNTSESSVDLSVGALIRSPQSRALKEELDKYKKECGYLKQQIEKVQLEKEGEIKILRENLNKKEMEISSMKQEKVNEIDRANKAQSEKEKQLQSEVNKLTTQLQFKERDLGNMKEKLQSLESRMTHSDLSQASPVRSQAVVVSPKRRKVGKEDKSPKSGFPTQQSFMSLERSPVIPIAGSSASRAPNIDVSTRDASTCTSLSTINVQGDKESVRKERRLGLGINMIKGNLSGSALVANLIEAVPDISDTNSERGIVGLLQSRTSAMDLIPFKFDRDSSNSLLSPIPNKRLNEIRHDNSVESSESLLLVSPGNYDLALEGMSCLLREDSVTSSTKNDKAILTDIESALDTSVESNSTCSSSQNILSNHSAAIYFLPLLNDYLSHYLEMLCTSVNCLKLPQTPKSSSSSLKGSSSDIESVTSSLELLLKNSASYANNLENLATISLRILYKLVSHSGAVRDFLLSSSPLEDTSYTMKEISEMETDQSSSSSLSTPPSLSSFCGSLTIVQSVIDLHLLSKVFRLANQGQNEHKCSVQVTKAALHVLTILATHTTETNVDRLLPIVNDGVVVNGLENDFNVSIVLQSVDLLTSLTRHTKIVNLLCTGPDRKEQDSCILYNLYTVCIHSVVSMSNKDFVELGNKVLDLLLNIQGIHDLGVSILTNEDCDCSLEVVKCIVLMLHQILQIFEETSNMTLIDILKKGLVLLHMIIMKEDPLVSVQNQVEYQFIRLIYGLEHVFKNRLQGNFSSEINLIHDLMDFHQDDSELSHDSEDADTQ